MSSKNTTRAYFEGQRVSIIDAMGNQQCGTVCHGNSSGAYVKLDAVGLQSGWFESNQLYIIEGDEIKDPG